MSARENVSHLTSSAASADVLQTTTDTEESGLEPDGLIRGRGNSHGGSNPRATVVDLEKWNGKPILPPEPDLVLETDASLLSWGARCDSQIQPRAPISLLALKTRLQNETGT